MKKEVQVPQLITEEVFNMICDDQIAECVSEAQKAINRINQIDAIRNRYIKAKRENLLVKIYESEGNFFLNISEKGPIGFSNLR